MARTGKQSGRGTAFEIQAVVNVIKGKEAEGQDASFERKLLKAWSKYKGYEKAKEALAGLQKPFNQI